MKSNLSIEKANLSTAKPGLRERLLKCVHDSNYAGNDKPCTHGPSQYTRSHNYQETEAYANNPPCQCTNRCHKYLLSRQYFELIPTTRPRSSCTARGGKDSALGELLARSADVEPGGNEQYAKNDGIYPDQPYHCNSSGCWPS